MVYLTRIHMSPSGRGHEHISRVEWKQPGTGKSGESTLAEMVAFIEQQKGEVKVTDGRNTVEVGVVRQAPLAPHLRTHADGKWTDNLLALPRF
ncbi:MAG: DUF3892 domain-containing protein [Deltaproteobacteria bacterium]|nr:DUF3892 domain-containing protein [Deltaproteobacteria bacterium]